MGVHAPAKLEEEEEIQERGRQEQATMDLAQQGAKEVPGR